MLACFGYGIRESSKHGSYLSPPVSIKLPRGPSDGVAFSEVPLAHWLQIVASCGLLEHAGFTRRSAVEPVATEYAINISRLRIAVSCRGGVVASNVRLGISRAKVRRTNRSGHGRCLLWALLPVLFFLAGVGLLRGRPGLPPRMLLGLLCRLQGLPPCALPATSAWESSLRSRTTTASPSKTFPSSGHGGRGQALQRAATGRSKPQHAAAGLSVPQQAAAGRSRPQHAAAGRSRPLQAAASCSSPLRATATCSSRQQAAAGLCRPSLRPLLSCWQPRRLI